MRVPTAGRRTAAALGIAALAGLVACGATRGPGGSAPSMRVVTTVAAVPAAGSLPLQADPQALAEAMRGAAVVLLGEVHDNAAQHALRADALARLLATGARPALAFEQFDRERQADLDRARREYPGDVDALIGRAAPGSGWDWALYRPFLRLALDHDLPIVAANLSRADASRVIREGFGAVFDAPAREALGLDALPAAVAAAHEREVDDGHCGLMPAAMLAPMARAQIARDAALAAAIAPHAARGVVLLTGNGHARRDIGVTLWLPASLQPRTIAIGLLEPGTAAAMPREAFDRVVRTPAAERGDPCAGLRARMSVPAPTRPSPAPSPADGSGAPGAAQGR